MNIKRKGSTVKPLKQNEVEYNDDENFNSNNNDVTDELSTNKDILVNIKIILKFWVKKLLFIGIFNKISTTD
jgi:hypothetical protein